MKRLRYRSLLAPLGALLLAAAVSAREFTVVAYNVENLFDLDGQAVFDEFAAPGYGPVQVLTKVRNVSAALRRFDDGRGPDIVLLNELEVDYTPSAKKPDYPALLKKYAKKKLADLLAKKPSRDVADLPSEFLLLKQLADDGLAGYSLVIGDDPPSPAGTAHPNAQKCAVLSRFPILEKRCHPTSEARQILEVKLDVDGSPLTVFCVHWKSGASDPVTEPLRIGNARVVRARLDEILRADPQADVIIGGDFNSQYNQSQRYRATMPETAINDVLGSQGNELAIRGPARALYNLWYELPAAERGSDIFRDEWGTLIQMIVSRGLYDFRGLQYVDNSFAVGKFAGLNMDAAGRPVRWDGAGAGSGFSDHFPVVAKFKTVADNAPDRWLALTGRAGTEETAAPAAARAERPKLDPATVLSAEKLPADANLQDGTWNRKVFLVQGKVSGEKPFRVEFRGQTFEVYVPDPAVRQKLWDHHAVGTAIEFYGELGNYKGRWQFVIQDAGWLK